MLSYAAQCHFCMRLLWFGVSNSKKSTCYVCALNSDLNSNEIGDLHCKNEFLEGRRSDPKLPKNRESWIFRLFIT